MTRFLFSFNFISAFLFFSDPVTLIGCTGSLFVFLYLVSLWPGRLHWLYWVIISFLVFSLFFFFHGLVAFIGCTVSLFVFSCTQFFHDLSLNCCVRRRRTHPNREKLELLWTIRRCQFGPPRKLFRGE